MELDLQIQVKAWAINRTNYLLCNASAGTPRSDARRAAKKLAAAAPRVFLAGSAAREPLMPAGIDYGHWVTICP
jgi:hypothetical protein